MSTLINKNTSLLFFSLFFSIISFNLVSAATCQGSWGDDGVTYPVPTSFSQFSDSDVVGLNCHLSGSQCPVPQVEGTCDTANQGFMRCNIEVRDSSGSWTSIAQSTAGEHCDFDDDVGSNFASVSNFMINHDDVTDIRCKAYALSYDATFDLCFVSTKGHDKRDDWWYNENTPTASNVAIDPSGATTLDDLNCDYTFNDSDNDSENLSAVQYKWFVNDIDVGVNAATLGNNSTDVSDIVVCSVKVFDDVFVTGNEAFVNSSPVNVSDVNETPGTLPQRREMSLDFEDKVETSYVMNGRNRVVEVFNDDKLYLHNDQVGSSSLKTDDSGEIDSEIITMPFGSQKADTGDGSSKSFFTGKETDNTGLQYFGARYYDPTSGRFTQIDPVQRSEQSNYWYANANPMKYNDPDGRNSNLIADFHAMHPPEPVVYSSPVENAVMAVVYFGASSVPGVELLSSINRRDGTGVVLAIAFGGFGGKANKARKALSPKDTAIDTKFHETVKEINFVPKEGKPNPEFPYFIPGLDLHDNYKGPKNKRIVSLNYELPPEVTVEDVKNFVGENNGLFTEDEAYAILQEIRYEKAADELRKMHRGLFIQPYEHIPPGNLPGYAGPVKGGDVHINPGNSPTRFQSGIRSIKYEVMKGKIPIKKIPGTDRIWDPPGPADPPMLN